MAGYFKWQEGRQKNAYRKMCLALSHTFHFDAWLIEYKDEGIGLHIDPSPKEGYCHKRLNIVIKKPDFGGKFMCFGESKTFLRQRVIFFRPSDAYHFASRAYGKRLVLSIGWLSKKNS